MENMIADVAQRAIAEKVFPGCVIGAVEKGNHTITPFGHYTYAEDSTPVTDESLYDCASITKSVPTATLALQLLDDGALTLDDKLIQFIPEYRTKYREDVRIRHLLTYTLGNTIPLSTLRGATVDEIFTAVCTEDVHEPGTIFNYSNTPAFLLGIVVERVLKTSLSTAAQERIFDPFGMKVTTFTPYGAVPTEEGIVDIVHDESARVCARAGTSVGHAGLFSTAGDLLVFLERLLAAPDDRMCTNQIAHLSASTALGWELDQVWMGEKRTPNTFGKTGFTGTCIVADFERQKALVILSNRTFPKASPDRTLINQFRARVCDIVFS